jgi:hypothetical protein
MIKCLAVLLLLVLTFSCGKSEKCHCPDSYETATNYKPGDIVDYQGLCFISIGYGRSITPNTKFLNNGNDIWIVCE